MSFFYFNQTFPTILKGKYCRKSSTINTFHCQHSFYFFSAQRQFVSFATFVTCFIKKFIRYNVCKKKKEKKVYFSMEPFQKQSYIRPCSDTSGLFFRSEVLWKRDVQWTCCRYSVNPYIIGIYVKFFLFQSTNGGNCRS